MRIATQKIPEDGKQLAREVRTLQNNINDTLSRVEFDSVMRLSVRIQPESLPISVAHTAKSPIWGVHAVYVRNLTDDSVPPLYNLGIDWVAEGGAIKIRTIDGLVPGNLYEIRFVAYA